MKKTNILFLDIEGGHGGSSKSLFLLIKNINRNLYSPHVFCKKSGFLDNYTSLKIPCLIYNKLPVFTSLQKMSRNIFYLFIFYFYFWPRSLKLRNEILKYIDENDIKIIHSNLISFFILIIWIKKKRPKLKFTLHLRTMPYKNLFSKIQAKISSYLFDDFIFITENEKHYFENLINQKIKGRVIYNSVELNKNTKKLKLSNNKDELKVLSLSNYSYFRGTDRIIEIAKEINRRQIKNITFYIAGDTVSKSLFSGSKKNLYALATKEDVHNIVKFLGYRNDACNIINSIDVLIKPTRENNPWGRDILEALASGKPIISIGKYKRFVKTNYTGLLLKNYDINEIISWLLEYKENKKLKKFYAKNAYTTIKKNCDIKKNILEVESFFNNLYTDKKMY